MSLSFVIPSTELIARIATMKKQPTPEKVWKLQHALEVNNNTSSEDPVCLYRNCLHHYSQHGKSWISDDNNGKRKRCRCRYMREGGRHTYLA